MSCFGLAPFIALNDPLRQDASQTSRRTDNPVLAEFSGRRATKIRRIETLDKNLLDLGTRVKREQTQNTSSHPQVGRLPPPSEPHVGGDTGSLFPVLCLEPVPPIGCYSGRVEQRCHQSTPSQIAGDPRNVWAAVFDEPSEMGLEGWGQQVTNVICAKVN